MKDERAAAKKAGARAATEWCRTAPFKEQIAVASSEFGFGETLDDLAYGGHEVPPSSDEHFSWGFFKNVKGKVMHAMYIQRRSKRLDGRHSRRMTNWLQVVDKAIASLPVDLTRLVKSFAKSADCVQVFVSNGAMTDDRCTLIEVRHWDRFADSRLPEEAPSLYAPGGVLEDYSETPTIVVSHAGAAMGEASWVLDDMMCEVHLGELVRVAVLNCLEAAGHVSRDDNGRYWRKDGSLILDRDGNELVNDEWLDDEEVARKYST